MWLLIRLCIWSTTAALFAAGGCQPAERPDGATSSNGPPQHQPAPYPLVVAVVGAPQTFNPIVADGQAGRTVGGAVFDTLLRLDPETAEPIAGLAASWTYDPQTHDYTVRLRDDVKWQDGVELTARDVAFTTRAIHAVAESPYSAILRIDGNPVEVREIDDRTVRFSLQRPYAPFLKSLVFPILPAHRFVETVPIDQPATIATQWGTDTDPGEVIGTGPFRLVGYQPDQRIVLERNPSYWQTDQRGERLPYLDRYIVRIAPDRETTLSWFKAGALHIFSPRFDEVAELRAASTRDEFAVEEIGTDTASLFLTFNRNPLHYRSGGKTDPRFTWFNDPRFLRGIAYAIDKRAIIEGALNGFGVPSRSLFPPANPFSDDELGGHPFDLELARRTLEMAGYPLRSDGVRQDDKGNPIEFTLVTNQGNAVRERIAAILVDQLATIGVRAKLESLPFPDLFERLDATYDWDAMLIGFTVGIDPASSENLLRSDGELHLWHPLQPHPSSAWEAQIDDLLDQGNRELDPTRRWEIYREVQAILHKQLPMIQLVRPTLFAAHRHGVENFRPSPWGFHAIEELRVRKIEPTKAKGSGNRR